MAWNSVESFINEALFTGLGLRARVGLDVIARISAFDARIALVKTIAEECLGVREERCEDLLKSLSRALAMAGELKRYRDGVVHCQLVDPNKALGLLIRRNGLDEVLLSQEALDVLYEHLVSVRDELRAVCLIFHVMSDALKSEPQADLHTLLHGPAIQVHVSQVQEHRNARLSLRPLPKFPQ